MERLAANGAVELLYARLAPVLAFNLLLSLLLLIWLEGPQVVLSRLALAWPGFVAGTTGDCLGVPGAGPCFQHVPAVGAGGEIPLGLPPVDGFLGVSTDRGVNGLTGFNCCASAGPISHYCITITQ